MNRKRSIFHQPIQRVFWLVVTALITLVLSQTYIIMQGAEVQKKEYEEQFDDLLLDIHHNVEDDEQLSNLLIHILRKQEQGVSPDSMIYKKAREELRVRIDSISSNYGIQLPFDFVIFHTGNRQYYFKSSEQIKSSINFQENSIKAGWRIKKQLGEGKYRIGLHFYNDWIHILLKLKTILILSILIIMLIAFGFWRTISGWKEQKELVALKNDFINNLTHELKTPIFSVSLLHKVIKKQLNSEHQPQLIKNIGLLEQENQKLKERVEKVLEIAAIENGSLKLDLQRLNMHQLIPDSIQLLEFLIKENRGQLNYSLNADHWILNGDPVHMKSIVCNLVDNAIKYSDQAPEILITTWSNDDYFFFSVKDHGVGIDHSSLKHVFEKFYRIPTGNLHQVKGFGLGLSYTKLVVEAHGGTITVESQPQRGSNFTVQLPLAKKQTNPALPKQKITQSN